MFKWSHYTFQHSVLFEMKIKMFFYYKNKVKRRRVAGLLPVFRVVPADDINSQHRIAVR